MRRLQFYFDFVCPYAYFASRSVDALGEQVGVPVEYEPMLLGGVFREIGAPDVPMNAVPAVKAAYMAQELERSARLAGVKLAFPANHPRRTVLALRAALASEDLVRATHALYAAYWAEGRDLEDGAEVAGALSRAGLDGKRAVDRASSAEIKARLRANTERAVSEGIFGAPAFVVHEGDRKELFWGHDRMDFVRDALRSAPRRAEFYFDYSSPFAYLASTQIAGLIERSGATIELKPLLLGGLFKSIGTPDVPLFEMPEAKRKYQLLDLERWAARYGVPFHFPSRFPMSTVKALRLTLVCPEAKRLALIDALFRALWVDDRDLASDSELREIGRSLDIDVDTLWPLLSESSTKPALRSATEAARARGIFGVPTFAIGSELFWGQDRIAIVEKALGGPRIAKTPE